MKAMAHDAYGAPLALRDQPAPAPGPDDVLIEVRAAGVDQGVWHVVAGLPYAIRLAGFGVRRPRRSVPGLDVAGVVQAAGERVTGIAPGDAVFGTADSTFAELAVSDAARLARKPERITFAQAATVSSGIAALQGLRDAGGLRAGHRVLVLGAGGGVGTFAVQLAVAMGATVTGVCSAAKLDRVRALGATEVLDYAVAEPEGPFDVVLDTGGNRPVPVLHRLLAPAGTAVIVGGEGGGRWLQGTDRQLRATLSRRRVTPVWSKATPELLETLRGHLERGTVTPIVDREFPLAQANEAIAHVRAGRPFGKVVLTP